MAAPNWSRFDILHICIMRKLGGNCVHPFVKNSMNFMNLKAIPLRSVTLPRLPEERGRASGRGRAGHGHVCVCAPDALRADAVFVFFSFLQYSGNVTQMQALLGEKKKHLIDIRSNLKSTITLKWDVNECTLMMEAA